MPPESSGPALTDSHGATSRATVLPAFLGLLACNLLWGLSFPVMALISRLPAIKSAAASSGPLSTTAAFLLIRFSLATLLMLVFLPRLSRGLTRLELRLGFGVGLMFGCGMVFQVLGLYDIPASRSAFLTSLSVVFAPMATIALHRRAPHVAVLAGSALALGGTAALTGVAAYDGPSGTFKFDLGAMSWGDLSTVAAAIFFTLQILAVDAASKRVTPVRITVGMFCGVVVIAASVLAALAATLGFEPLQPLASAAVDARFASLTIALTLLSTIAPFVLMNHYQHHFSPAHASLIYTLEPVFATFWACILPELLGSMVGVEYPSEGVTVPTLIGGSLIALGNVVALLQPHAARETSHAHAPTGVP